MAEHGCDPDAQAIGVIFDGTGYGPDGTIWGGEFLVGGYANFERVGRLRPFPLPGGDTAIKRPYRIALALLWALGLRMDRGPAAGSGLPAAERRVLTQQLDAALTPSPPAAWAASSTPWRVWPVCAKSSATKPRPRWSSRRSPPRLTGSAYWLPLISDRSTLQSKLQFEFATDDTDHGGGDGRAQRRRTGRHGGPLSSRRGRCHRRRVPPDRRKHGAAHGRSQRRRLSKHDAARLDAGAADRRRLYAAGPSPGPAQRRRAGPRPSAGRPRPPDCCR